MKIARFSTGDVPRYGILDEEVGELVVLAGDPLFAGFDTTGERVSVTDVRLLAPVIPRSKVVGVSALDAEAEPTIYLKPNTAVVGPGEQILVPAGAGRIAASGALAVIIGSVTKGIKAEDWADHVFGYTLGNDVSALDLMTADGQWARAKGYDTFAPLGPVIETELDPAGFSVATRVDGQQAGEGRMADLAHDLPTILETVAEAFTLLPGDVVLVPTGAAPVEFTGGQLVEVTAPGFGILPNPARDRG